MSVTRDGPAVSTATGAEEGRVRSGRENEVTESDLGLSWNGGESKCGVREALGWSRWTFI